MPPKLAGRLEARLTAAGAEPGAECTAEARPLLAFGRTELTRSLIRDEELEALGPEGFLLRSGRLGSCPVWAAAGNGQGSAYAAYALLEEMGFAFLHPLRPITPEALRLPTSPLELASKPRWPVRAWHLHTQHPTELCELLNGWGPGGPTDEAGWRAGLGEWDSFLEWLVANRQNQVEWILLSGVARPRERLRELVDHAHGFGIQAGLDVPLALRQQHAYRLIRTRGTLDAELAELSSRLAPLLEAGFDFLSTEMGTSEFTHPDAARMLAWMNEFARIVAERGKRALVKVHVSTGQTLDELRDPATGAPLNFNFLPKLADPSLGVLVHTVQHYALDDPAPTYGNTNFGAMRGFLREAAGQRETVWYPETAYWVSFDVDVPLFLPVYAERRLHDLWLLAEDEERGKMGGAGRLRGQMVFSSGWEWGYWLNDVVAARAAWDPGLAAASEEDALLGLLLRATRPMGEAAPEAAAWLAETAKAQHELLIEGRVAGRRPISVERRNGQAYLQGVETWDELSKPPGASKKWLTQPERLSLAAAARPFQRPDYETEVRPLLEEMQRRFTELADRLETLRPKVAKPGLELFEEMLDAMRMTELRSRQALGLYDWARFRKPESLASARAALAEASRVVARREAGYRVPVERVAGWRENPTAYEFGYLWPAHTLYYWRRDEAKATDAPASPCFMNIIGPVDIAIGDGFWSWLALQGREMGGRLGLGAVTECLAAPAREPSVW